ncbi:thiamine pyrophosphate-dependent enzyme [Candidatus Pelagibacter sp. Uisw_136]|uniref:thiamine pyrophosphate-dependent enzyme n=1 Tax=Candidatus Pelagibacter sp. Uisw_136 TaxID=3230991 RepID=UPI0039E8CE7A
MSFIKLKKIIENSKRPVVLAGSGVAISGTEKELFKFIKKNSIPIVTAWAHDIYPNNDKDYYGRQGAIGNRVGNFVVQYADLVLVLGSRLNVRQTSYNWKEFAKNAIIISVDIDLLELNKNLIHIDYKIHMDLKVFFKKFSQVNLNLKDKNNNLKWLKWIKWCEYIRKNFTPKIEDYKIQQNKINIYHFIINLFKSLKNKEIIVAADGAATVVPNQVGYLNKGIKYIANSGSASMGFELPAAIGASIADRKNKIICLAGDGSIMMNLQELETIKSLNLNVIIFLINNDGYLSIKQTQKNFFGNEHGSSPKSGLTFPNFIKVAKSFGIKSYNLKLRNWNKTMNKILMLKGPLFVNVDVDTKQEFEPKLKSKKVNNKIITPSLENMYPFLSEETNRKILKKLNE